MPDRTTIIHADRPDNWFEDDELAVRIYRNVRNYELAVYGYWGFWKQPSGQTDSGTAIFPELNVYGASIRGQMAGGIGNLELAYYDSVEDSGGGDPLIDNSEMRYVVGYTRDLAMDLNASLQYYVEQLLDYGAYKESLSGIQARDEFRQVITLQLTQLLMNQTLGLSLSGYYSPSDKDAYSASQGSAMILPTVSSWKPAPTFSLEKRSIPFSASLKTTRMSMPPSGTACKEIKERKKYGYCQRSRREKYRLPKRDNFVFRTSSRGSHQQRN